MKDDKDKESEKDAIIQELLDKLSRIRQTVISQEESCAKSIQILLLKYDEQQK